MWLAAGVLNHLYQEAPCERQAAEGGPSVPRKTGGAAGRMGDARRKGACAVLRTSDGRAYPRQCAPGLVVCPDALPAILWECIQSTSGGDKPFNLTCCGPASQEPLQPLVVVQRASLRIIISSIQAATTIIHIGLIWVKRLHPGCAHSLRPVNGAGCRTLLKDWGLLKSVRGRIPS